MENQDFWDRVKILMKSRSLTQTDLSEKIHVTVPVIKNWIYRSILPDAEKAALIAKALGTTVEYLVTGADVSTPSPETKKLKKIKEEIQNLLLNFDD